MTCGSGQRWTLWQGSVNAPPAGPAGTSSGLWPHLCSEHHVLSSTNVCSASNAMHSAGAQVTGGDAPAPPCSLPSNGAEREPWGLRHASALSGRSPHLLQVGVRVLSGEGAASVLHRDGWEHADVCEATGLHFRCVHFVVSCVCVCLYFSGSNGTAISATEEDYLFLRKHNHGAGTGWAPGE